MSLVTFSFPDENSSSISVYFGGNKVQIPLEVEDIVIESPLYPTPYSYFKWHAFYLL